MGLHHLFISSNQPQDGDTFGCRECQVVAGTMNVVAVNFFTQTRAVRKTSLEHGRQVITLDVPLQTQGFRPFTQPEALEISKKIIVIRITVVTGGSAG
ncbi:hypothetical protein D3C80_1976650 [compost metagenome]